VHDEGLEGGKVLLKGHAKFSKPRCRAFKGGGSGQQKEARDSRREGKKREILDCWLGGAVHLWKDIKITHVCGADEVGHPGRRHATIQAPLPRKS
jgi:hypothetical protein